MPESTQPKVLITGGAGFIGTNAAHYFSKKGFQVVLFDNKSRKGSEDNLSDLTREGVHYEFIQGDLRDFHSIQEAVRKHRDAALILHLAAQVAVTTSVLNPREDFECNALGTFNLLEAIRTQGCRAHLIYASTNKVYGGMEGLSIIEKETAYAYEDLPAGVNESFPLDFHSPYGCSKGAADQYVRDYHRIYGIPTTVFRQSCVYGPYQYGMEDQGWVAWFTIGAVVHQPRTIFGDGKQIRDVLFSDDLSEAYYLAWKNSSKTAGQVYNIGGGPIHSLSIIELLKLLRKELGVELSTCFEAIRPGDQRVFVSNTTKAERDFGWKPETSVHSGLLKLIAWIKQNKNRFMS